MKDYSTIKGVDALIEKYEREAAGLEKQIEGCSNMIKNLTDRHTLTVAMIEGLYRRKIAMIKDEESEEE